MERATKAIKRGSIRLKSYSEINLIISDLDEMRSCGRAYFKAYQTFIEDLSKWAHQESNESMKTAFAMLTELTDLWSGIHVEYLENVKKLRQQFDLVLESEQSVDKARNNAARCQEVEMKLEKKRSNMDVEEKLVEAKRAVELAKVEVTQKENENKIMKLIRIKEGLKKMTDCILALTPKSSVIMQAQKAVVCELPDEPDRGIQIAGECRAKTAVAKAKTTIQTMNCSSNLSQPDAPTEYEAPPPYSPHFGMYPQSDLNRTNRLPGTQASTSFSAAPLQSEPASNIAANRRLIDQNGCGNHLKTYICCRCSAQLISDHMYMPTPDVPQMSSEMMMITGMQNTRLS